MDFPPCQGGGSEFEPRHPLQKGLNVFCIRIFFFCEFFIKFIFFKKRLSYFPHNKGKKTNHNKVWSFQTKASQAHESPSHGRRES